MEKLCRMLKHVYYIGGWDMPKFVEKTFADDSQTIKFVPGRFSPWRVSHYIVIPYFLVIRRMSLISAYSLLSACYFVDLSTRY
jgi:hypothetical protein